MSCFLKRPIVITTWHSIITEFRGRSEIIEITPLSFAEFYPLMQGHAEFREIMESYFLFGGLPECVLLDTEPEKTCSLHNVRDSFRKVVITGDAHETPWMDQNGILFIGLKAFLLDPHSLETL